MILYILLKSDYWIHYL